MKFCESFFSTSKGQEVGTKSPEGKEIVRLKGHVLKPVKKVAQNGF